MIGAPPLDPDASGGGVEERDERRAHEVLTERPPRRVAGQGLAERVGARRWERAPVVCCSERIFKRCEVADPWNPDSSDRPIGIGPVGMRFEERRQPAPHARVKEPKKPSSGPVWTPPTGIPQAAPRPPAAKPAAAVRRPPSDEPLGPAAGRSLPPVAPPPVEAKSRSGRFRMRSTSATGPKVRPLPVIATPSPAEQVEPNPAPPAETPRPGPQPQSLDDLFGNFGGGGRDKRVGKKKP
ncbi:MAG: hypothetical protein ABIO70_23125 [Pseudomonadota bacterium]